MIATGLHTQVMQTLGLEIGTQMCILVFASSFLDPRMNIEIVNQAAQRSGWVGAEGHEMIKPWRAWPSLESLSEICSVRCQLWRLGVRGEH